MNFYSDEIINDIIDHSEIENIIPEIETFKNTSEYLLQRNSMNDIHHKYTKGLLEDEQNIIAFYCMDFEFSIYNCPSMMVYQKYNDIYNNEIRYYILLMCTKYKFRGQGYASKLLDGFIEHIRLKNNDTLQQKKTIKIILSSVENSVLFYEAYGFKWKCESISDHPILMQYEKYEMDKEYFILEYIL